MKSLRFSNVLVSGNMNSSGTTMGGIVGNVYGGNNYIVGCQNNVTTNAATVNKGHVGGIVARIDSGNVYISGCINQADLHSNTFGDGASNYMTDYCGGIVGSATGSSSNELFIENCVNNGSVLGDTSGAIVGYSEIDGQNSIMNCMNNGYVSGDYCGGIIGKLDASGVDNAVVGCSNNGFIGSQSTKLRNVGGLIGVVDGGAEIDLHYCTHYGFAISNVVLDKATIKANTIKMVTNILGIAGGIIGLVSSIISFNPWGIITGIIGLANSIYAFIDWLITARIFVTPQAAGIVSEIDQGFLKDDAEVHMSNVLSLGIVRSSSSEEDVLCNDGDVDIKRNVYSLDDSVSSSDTHGKNDVVNFRNQRDFESGKVAAEIEANQAGIFFV